jgi:hypothetical protein
MNGTGDDTLQNDNKKNGNVSGVRKMTPQSVKMDSLQTIKMDTVTLIGKGR